MKITSNNAFDWDKSFAKLKILIDLREKATQDTIMGMAIIKAIDDKKPGDQIISWVKSQALDERTTMYAVIGQELTERILNF